MSRGQFTRFVALALCLTAWSAVGQTPAAPSPSSPSPGSPGPGSAERQGASSAISGASEIPKNDSVASVAAATSDSQPAESKPSVPASAQPTSAQPVVMVVPDSPSYIALTKQQKLHHFMQRTYSPYTFFGVAFDAGWAQMTDDWPAYGQGMAGYGKRYGALLADGEAAAFFQGFLLPTLLHTDPRYFRQGPGRPLLERISYAVSRVAITRADSGHDTVNTPQILGSLLCAIVSNAYYPRPQRGVEYSASRLEGSLLSIAQTNLLREFMPDLRRIFKKHEPEKLKRLEEKVPFSEKIDPDVHKEEPSSAPKEEPASPPKEEPASVTKAPASSRP